MKHKPDCGNCAPRRQGFFADVVVWSGGTRGVEIQGRVIPSEMLPNPAGSQLELRRLTVKDECARQTDARIEYDACGTARAVGRLTIPLEAEFTDACGNTYTGSSEIVYDVSIAACDIERGECGNVVLDCEARDMTVQVLTCDSVNYTLKLDVYAYLTRYELVRPETGGCAANANMCAGRMPGAAFVQSVTPDALAAGAMRGRQPGALPAVQPAVQMRDDDDEYRTVVAMPVHKRRHR